MKETDIAQANRGFWNRLKSSSGRLALPSHQTKAMVNRTPSAPRPTISSDTQPSRWPLVSVLNTSASAAASRNRPVQSNGGSGPLLARSGRKIGPSTAATAISGIGMAKI